ncbi:MAG: DUF362 domain-containing protein [Deltaproteobacteria bacterium]|nr:DUF362 domain-containing protein [Deltaproteobacteria bacterium]
MKTQDKKKVTRRGFLFLLAAVGAAFGLFRSCHSLKVFFKSAESKAPAEGPRNLYTRGGKSLVSVVGGRDLGEMVERAVSLIGGFDRMPVRGKRILVKPNVVGARSNPTTTNPALVGAVVERLFHHGAAEVLVGDMSALIRGGTAKNMEKTGIAAAARRAGAETVSFEDHGWVAVEVEGRYLEQVEVTDRFFEVDRVINLPVIKTHRYAGYSICLKNLVGATHFSQRPYLVDRAHWEEVVAELNLAFSFPLHIVDGTRIMVEGGPWEGTAKETHLVLAGGDPLACDVVGLAMIKSFGRWERLASRSPWEMRQVKRAMELGLGAADSAQMEILEESLDRDPDFSPLMRRVRTLLA